MWDLFLFFFFEARHKISLVYRQEMTSKVPPLRALYKMSCWLSYRPPARKALRFNWPSICFEGHPPITGAHKHGGVKPNCTWAGALLKPLITAQEGAHAFLLTTRRPLSWNADLILPITMLKLAPFKIFCIVATKPGSERAANGDN